MNLTIFFCRDCGAGIYKEADADMFQGIVVVGAGTLDDINSLNQVQTLIIIEHVIQMFPTLKYF
jgi:hypothetical protein